MTKEEFVASIAEAIEFSGDLNGTTLLDDIDEWDSLGWLGVIAFLDEINVAVDLSMLSEVKTLDELMDHVFKGNDQL